MSDQASSAESIFGQAIEIQSDDDRAAFLDQACGHDPQLLAEVEQLVNDHFRAGSFLEKPAMHDGVTTAMPPITEKVGARIGPYKLLQVIGEGGMGVVHMAEQRSPVKRRVALKIIKAGMDTEQVIARFGAERQALAMMDHPNIARVLDAGTTESGRPFFVMELVKGIPITEFADQQKLSPTERLKLFVEVCRAVQHAHQKGVIHRDLKPSNVLVAKFDDRPAVKVIDFGVAKAINQELTDQTLFTQFGQIVGTLEYMSPEQAQLNQLDVDTRADVYSLGVLLYELLTGDTPLDRKRLRSVAFDEVLRIIREEEPPRPSIKVRSSATLSALAENRQVDPKKLGNLMQGDLDWIIMKSLDKDRSRRYETANGMADDIVRYLQNEPIVARPPSAAYRSAKFARRNKSLLLTVSSVFLLLVAGLAATSVVAMELAKTKATLENVIHDQAVLAIINGDVIQSEQILEQIASTRFDQHKLKKLKALHNFFSLLDIDGTYETLIEEFEGGTAEFDAVALLAITSAWKGDTNLYFRVMQRFDKLGYEGISDQQRLLAAMAEMTRNNKTSLELCESVISRHPSWIQARVIECICRGYVGVEESRPEQAQRALDIAKALRQLVPDVALVDTLNFLTAYDCVLAAEKRGILTDEWIEIATREAENLERRKMNFANGLTPFYEHIGDLQRANKLSESWRNGLHNVSGPTGDSFRFEYVAFLMRQDKVREARHFLDGLPTDCGPWTDLSRMVLNVLESEPGWQEKNIQLINRWAAEKHNLYPPFRIHLVTMALLAEDEPKAIRLAQSFTSADRPTWPSSSDSVHQKLLIHFANLDQSTQDELRSLCTAQDNLTLAETGELYYHLGVYWMAQGNRELAIDCFSKVPHFGPFGFGNDYYFTRPLLNKLKTQE